MKKNASIFLGLGLIGVAVFYFVNKTEGKKTSKEFDVPPPPSGSSTKVAKKVDVVGDVSKALIENENPAIYNAKLVWMNNLLQLSSFQPFVDKYTNTYLARFYTLWKGTRVEVSQLPYGEPNKGSVDRYIFDLLAAGSEIRKKLA